MGHANLTNISNFFLRRLYAKGSLSIEECVKALIAAKETVHASEGEYEDENMLGFALDEVVGHLLSYWENNGKRGRKSNPVIETSELNDDQARILSQHMEQSEEWEDWDTEEYALFDSIKWKYAPGWRQRYKEVEVLGNVEN